jgi:hypothetical protein
MRQLPVCQFSVPRNSLETGNCKLETCFALLLTCKLFTQHITTSLTVYRRGFGDRNIAAPIHPVRLG